jgi:hypothetical protein
MSVVFALFWITSAVFVGDVLLGKISVLTGGAVHQVLGELAHFFLLALTAVFLTAECLRREARRNAASTNAAAANNSQALSSQPTGRLPHE